MKMREPILSISTIQHNFENKLDWWWFLFVTFQKYGDIWIFLDIILDLKEELQFMEEAKVNRVYLRKTYATMS